MMDLGCPLLRGSSDRRLRRHVATQVVLEVENDFMDQHCYSRRKAVLGLINFLGILVLFVSKHQPAGPSTDPQQNCSFKREDLI